MNYTFDKNIPYEFKDLTGLEEEYKIGISIVEDGKVIEGIAYIEEILPLHKMNPVLAAAFKKPIKCCGLAGIELLPENRNMGKGTFIIKDLLKKFDCINAGVQEEKAWEWWKRMGALEYMAVMSPEDIGKANPKAHSLGFVLGKDKLSTMLFSGLFRMASSQMPSCQGATNKPEIDFSKNK